MSLTTHCDCLDTLPQPLPNSLLERASHLGMPPTHCNCWRSRHDSNMRPTEPSLDFFSKVSTHERAHRAGWYAQGKTGRNRKHTIIATRTALTKCGSENWTS